MCKWSDNPRFVLALRLASSYFCLRFRIGEQSDGVDGSEGSAGQHFGVNATLPNAGPWATPRQELNPDLNFNIGLPG